MSRLNEVCAIVKLTLTKNLLPKIEYRFQRLNYRDFQTSVTNPYVYAGPGIDRAGTTGLQRMLFPGADTPGYWSHVFTVTIEYHFWGVRALPAARLEAGRGHVTPEGPKLLPWSLQMRI